MFVRLITACFFYLQSRWSQNLLSIADGLWLEKDHPHNYQFNRGKPTPAKRSLPLRLTSGSTAESRGGGF